MRPSADLGAFGHRRLSAALVLGPRLVCDQHRPSAFDGPELNGL